MKTLRSLYIIRFANFANTWTLHNSLLYGKNIGDFIQIRIANHKVYSSPLFSLIRYVFLGIDCGSPGTLMNGTVDSNGTFVTSVATFMCDFGFNLIGDTQRICQENGNWSNMVPECERKLLPVCRILN